jgi:hypothetical protein
MNRSNGKEVAMARPADDQTHGPDTRDPRLLAPVSELAAELLTKVLDALDAGKAEEAVRAFLHAAASSALPGGASLRPWLLQAIGREAAVRLAEALAVQPCFYCEQGTCPCDACAGAGRVTGRGACNQCVGLGHVSCQFCNGSGWAPVDFVPPALRLDVVVARVRLAMVRIKKLVEARLPPAGSGDPQQVCAVGAKLLDALNRKVAVLENALVALKDSVPAESATPETAARVKHACVSTARRAEQRMREVLALMAEASRRQAAPASTPEALAAAGQMSALYERLARESFDWTTLAHPFIPLFGRATSGPEQNADSAAGH